MSKELSDEQWAEIEEKAQARWEELVERRPSPDSVGFYCYGDASPAIGGGVGSFCWFDGQDEVWEFVSEVLPFSPPGPLHKNHLHTQQLVKETIGRHRAGSMSIEECRSELNERLRSYSQIEWFGTLEQLTSGTGEFALSVIERFREEYEDEGEDEAPPPSPIAPTELDDFLDFLDTYGI